MNSFLPFSKPLSPGPAGELFRLQDSLLLNGEKYSVVDLDKGILSRSLYLTHGSEWREALAKADAINTINGITLLAGNAGYRNYYHWLAQIWLSVLHVQRHLGSLAGITIAFQPLSDARKQFLRLCGITQYVVINPNSAYFIRHAIISDICWGAATYCKANATALLSDSIDLPPAPIKADCLYISRQDSRKRPVTNETDVVRALEQLGFASLCLSDFSLGQQAALFRNAKVIVAPHGAGLANLLFTPTRAQVFELLPEDYQNPCYYAIACQRALSYTCMTCEVSSHSAGRHHSAMTVDIRETVKRVSQMLSAEKEEE
jgi:capsular polysaccharide biosynthesis protein